MSFPDAIPNEPIIQTRGMSAITRGQPLLKFCKQNHGTHGYHVDILNAMGWSLSHSGVWGQCLWFTNCMLIMILAKSSCYNPWLTHWLIINIYLTSWGRVMYICDDNLTIVGSDNGIIWTIARVVLIEPLRKNSYIFIEEYVFENTYCKLMFNSSRPQCVNRWTQSIYVDDFRAKQATIFTLWCSSGSYSWVYLKQHTSVCCL